MNRTASRSTLLQNEIEEATKANDGTKDDHQFRAPALSLILVYLRADRTELRLSACCKKKETCSLSPSLSIYLSLYLSLSDAT